MDTKNTRGSISEGSTQEGSALRELGNCRGPAAARSRGSWKVGKASAMGDRRQHASEDSDALFRLLQGSCHRSAGAQLPHSQTRSLPGPGAGIS
ncbi:hypothetical protein HJG60_011433 [Phyllostomus discolor]|uniref:Uncharacterized protein n=1 Tax=Phyllostomus discolor TaxID=89673 RepID=A0A834A2P9_9CHIR|nr:hypothetical protein HJG60_011433 [Phyllostomus discolor]